MSKPILFIPESSAIRLAHADKKYFLACFPEDQKIHVYSHVEPNGRVHKGGIYTYDELKEKYGTTQN